MCRCHVEVCKSRETGELKHDLPSAAFLIIPILSTSNLPRTPLGHSSRKLPAKNSHRRRRIGRRQLPASYQPPQSVVDAPFIPLPTRRHFRISHVGNQRRRPALGTVVYTNHSSSESDEYCSEDAHHKPEPVEHFRLVFGKRLRGEEQEFRGLSAMKGSRLSARPSTATFSSPHHDHPESNHTQKPSPPRPEPAVHEKQHEPTLEKKSISFAATTQACTQRISTQIDSSLSFLSCQLK
ncbi:hypothetical protein PtA15_3A50 [Puccinia triticina]|uniref:Uncharacterized protein n=1 Tax=Puccinia triticina TaxID=208348 RepID=A0ABY7CE03_9BASI|nr:uncharacterized protein PtA15_3A50 [Puccinia triticina]WAQ82687.1 hypothetical protein PtA15_3A50 [Puccinia triticina]WAR53531.1 hypothetical protein PtB15_3B39 [Puccinia triticina]